MPGPSGGRARKTLDTVIAKGSKESLGYFCSSTVSRRAAYYSTKYCSPIEYNNSQLVHTHPLDVLFTLFSSFTETINRLQISLPVAAKSFAQGECC